MKFRAKIEVVLRPSILDPQGKVAQHALHNLGYDNIEYVRMGKLIEMLIDAESDEKARATATAACQKVLANAVMEDFSIEIEQVEEAVA